MLSNWVTSLCRIANSSSRLMTLLTSTHLPSKLKLLVSLQPPLYLPPLLLLLLPSCIMNNFITGDILGGSVNVNDNGSSLDLLVNNTFSYPDSCIATAKFHRDTYWGDLNIDCAAGICSIIHESPGTILNFDNFDVTGAQVDLNILSIKANQVNVEIQKGTLTFNRAEIQQDSVVTTQDGDVIFQAEKDFSVFWENQNSYYCLGAPLSASITNVTVPSGCWTDSTDVDGAQKFGGRGVTNCTAYYSMCHSSNCTTIPKITMQAGKGSIYSNLIQPGTTSLPSQAMTETSAPFAMGGIDLDQTFNQTLYDMNKAFEDRSKSDHMVLLTIGNYRARSSAASKVTVSPNPAYIDMRPWWLSVFSASLLLGFPLQGSGRLMPGFCPFRTTLNDEQVYDMSELLGETFATPNQVVNIQASELGKLSTSFNHNQGYLASEGTDDWVTVVRQVRWLNVRDKEGTLKIEHDELSDNGALLAAMIVSLLLSGILSVVGLFILFYVLYQAFTGFSKDSAHIEKYSETYHEAYLKGKETQKHVHYQVPAQFQQKHNHAEECTQFVARIKVDHLQPKGHTASRVAEPMTIFGKIKLTLKNLPPPFALIDHLLFLLGRAITNSLIEYYKLVFKQIPSQDLEESVNTMSLAEFKLRYEKFCFLKSYEERLMTTEKNARVLNKYGFEIIKKKDNLTEVYKKIRFFTDKEEKTKMSQAKHKISAQRNKKSGGSTKELDSVNLFIKTNCVKTKFDTDQIVVSQFKQKYHDFCEENRLNPVNITRSLMATYGIETEKLELSYVCRKPKSVLEKEAKGKEIKYYTLQTDKVDHEIEKMILNYFVGKGQATSQQQKEFLKKREHKESAFTQNWLAIDFLAVVLHVLFAVVFALLPVFIVIFSQSMRAFYLTSPARDVLSYQDFVYTPWNIVGKIGTLRAYDLAIFIASVIYAFLALVELIVYYASMPFPLDTLKYFSDMKKEERSIQRGKGELKRARNVIVFISQIIQWFYIFFIIAFVLGYIGLVLVWSILGAILNPTAYLYYAAAAGTFITYVGVKYKQLQDMQRKGFSHIMQIIEVKVQGMIDQLLKRVISATGMSDDMAKAFEASVDAAVAGDISKLEGAAIQFVNATPVGKSMAAQGIDVSLVVRMAKGDMSAIVEFAKNKGIPAPVAQGLVCLLQGDMNGVVKALKTLVSQDPLNLPPELVDIVVALVLRPSEVSRREVLNTLAQMFYNFVDQKLEIEMPNFQICKVVLPLIFQAIAQLFESNRDGFLDRLIQINEMLINSCQKYHNLYNNINASKLKPALGDKKSDQQYERVQKLKKPLFNDIGQPNYAVPRHLLYFMELFKLPLNAHGLTSINKPRLKKAIYEILSDFSGMDDDIIDFLIITFAQSPSRIDAVMQPGVITRMKQMSIVNELSKELDLDLLIMKTLFKVVTIDKTIDDRYYEEVNDRCRYLLKKINRQNEDQYLHRDFVALSYGLFITLNSANIQSRLVRAAREFKIDPITADTLFKIASKVDHSEALQKRLITSDIIAVASKELRISKQDVSGLISFLMGDLKNPFVDNILRSFCVRNSLPEQTVPLLSGLIKLLSSKKCSELLEAIQTLGLRKYQALIMIGKKMIHPKYIEEDELRSFGIDEEMLRNRLSLSLREDLDEWIKKASRKMLGGNNASHRDLVLNTQHLEANKGKNEGSSGALMQLAQLIKQPSLLRRKTEIRKSHFSHFIKPKVADEFANKMLTLKNQTLSIIVLKEIVQKWRAESTEKIKDFTPIQYDLILKLLSVKEIILRTSRQDVHGATTNLVTLLGFNFPIINALVNIIINDSDASEGKLDTFINQIYKDKEVGPRSLPQENLTEFAHFISEELASFKHSENVIKTLSEVFGIPKSLVARYLTPQLNETSNMSVNDVCYLFDLAGLNEYKFEQNEIKLQAHHISLTRLKFMLSNICVGYIPKISEVQRVFGLEGKLGSILEALCSHNQQKSIQIMLELYRELLDDQGLPKRVVQTLLAVFAFLKGNSQSFKFQYEEGTEQLKHRLGLLLQAQNDGNEADVETYKHARKDIASKYLAKMFGTYPEYFQSLQSILQGEYKRLPQLLSNLVQQAQDQGTHLIPPQYIPGLLSIAAGKIYSTEDIAEKLNVSPDLLDVCILLSGIAKGSKKGEKKIATLSSNNNFARFCKLLKLNKNAFCNILRLSFNQVGNKEQSEVFGALRLYEHCEEKYLKAIMAISRGTNNQALFDTEEAEIAFKLRQEHVAELEQNLAPLCDPFGVPLDLAVVNTRLRQGDFLIIQDYRQYLAPLLPNKQCRDLAMALCGILRCPIQYNSKLGAYPKESKYGANFQGALQKMRDVFGINPIVFRLCTFDPEALVYVEEKFNVSRQVVIAFMITLANLPPNMVKFLMEKDIYRCSYLETNKNIEMGKELKLEAENRSQSNRISVESISGDDDHSSINESEDISFDESIDDLDKQSDQQIGEEYFDPFKTRYDKIDFEDTFYDKWCRAIQEIFDLQEESDTFQNQEENDSSKELDLFQAVITPEQEVVELFVFNTPYLRYFSYDQILSLDQGYRNFNLDKSQIKRILGKKEDWDKALDSCFNKKQKAQKFSEDESDDSIEPQKKNFQNSYWLCKRDRPYVKNIWEIMKNLMRDLSKDVKMTNGAAHKDERIELSQFLFANSILGVRRTLESDKYTGKTEDFQEVVGGLNEMFNWIERNSIIPGRLDYAFHPNRVLKVLAMATNLKFSSYFDSSKIWRHEFFNAENFPTFSPKKFKAEQDITRLNSSYNEYTTKLEQKGLTTGTTFLKFFEPQEQNQSAKEVYIENERTARDYWPESLPRYQYNPAAWKYTTQSESELAQYFMIIPKEINQLYEQQRQADESGKVQDNVEDPRSKMTSQKVFLLFEQLERYLIADPEPMQLIIGIADNNMSAWTLYKEKLQRAKIIQKESSLQVYQSVQRLVTLKKVVKDYKYSKSTGDDRLTEPPDVKRILNGLAGSSGLDPVLVEDLIMLAHGNIYESYYGDLANRFNIHPDLLKTFFLSNFLQKFSNPRQLQHFMQPMVQALGVNPLILTAVINIMSFKKLGWEILGINLTKQSIEIEKKNLASQSISTIKIDAFKMLNKMLDIIDWKKLQSRKVSANQLKLAHKDYSTFLLEIADMLHGQGTLKYAKNYKLQLLLKLLHSVLIKDVPKTLDLLKNLSTQLDYDPNSDALQNFQAVCLLVGKQNLSLKSQSTLVQNGKETLKNWLSQQIVQNDDSESMLLEEARAKAKGLVELIFGFNFNNMEGLDKGAKAIGGKFEKLT